MFSQNKTSLQKTTAGFDESTVIHICRKISLNSVKFCYNSRYVCIASVCWQKATKFWLQFAKAYSSLDCWWSEKRCLIRWIKVSISSWSWKNGVWQKPPEILHLLWHKDRRRWWNSLRIISLESLGASFIAFEDIFNGFKELWHTNCTV